GQIGGNLALGSLADRSGHVASLVIGTGALLGANVLALSAPSLEVFTLVFLLQGVQLAAVNVSGLNVLLEFAPGPAARPTYVGLGTTLTTPVAFGAPLLAGLMADLVGFPAVFLAAGMGALISAGVLLGRVREPRRLTESLMARRQMCVFRFGQLAAVMLLILASASPAAAQSRDQIARGKYIFGAAAGCGCHTEPKGGVLNAGGRKYDGPFGTVYSSNITPDPANGIGKWTDEQIITAIRAGRRPNGERLIPVHPYTVFNGMAEQDLKDVVAYLRSVPPSSKPTPAKKIAVPMFESVFLPAWLATFAPRENPPASAPTAGVARGEYLTRAVTHCGECHTPRTMTMATDNSRFLAGAPKGKGPEGSAVPNITPDRDSGIGSWTEEQIADYLETGNKPDGDVAGGLMAEVI